MKRNKKLESKFFRPFQVLHAVWKQVYKLELITKWKIHGVIHISLLEQDTTRRGRVNNKALLELEKEFEVEGDKEYEFEAIIDSAVYGQQVNSNQIPGLYYRVL